MKDTFDILGFDAFHPNVRAMYRSASLTGWRIRQCERRRRAIRQLLFSRHRATHFHWIDDIVTPLSRASVCVRLCFHLMLMCLVRLRGGRMVWTVHNCAPHDDHHRHLSRLSQRVTIGFSSVLHFPTRIVADDFLREYPSARRRPSLVVPLPTLDQVYGSTPSTQKAGSPLATFLAFGALRPYKGLHHVIRAFRALPSPEARLIIAGPVGPEDYVGLLVDLIGDDHRIDFRPGWVNDEEIEPLFACADWVVLGYNEVSNSGVASLALTFDRPCVGPDLPALREVLGPALTSVDIADREAFSLLLAQLVAADARTRASARREAEEAHARIRPQSIAHQLGALYSLAIKRPVSRSGFDGEQ